MAYDAHLWKINPDAGYTAEQANAFTLDRPAFIYIGGTGDLNEPSPPPNLNKFFYTLFDPTSIADPMPGAAKKLGRAPDVDIYALTEGKENDGPKVNLENIILPHIPDTLEELKRSLSRFTFLTFSRGTDYTNSGILSLPGLIKQKIRESGKFSDTEIEEVLGCMAAVQVAPSNLPYDMPSDGQEGNKNLIPSIAAFVTDDASVASRFRNTRTYIYNLPDEKIIHCWHDKTLRRLVIAGRKVVPSHVDVMATLGQAGHFKSTTKGVFDSHHPYVETNTTGYLALKDVLTYQVSPYAHIVKHALQQLVHGSEVALASKTPRDAAAIIKTVREQMFSDEAIQQIPGYMEDAIALHNAHSRLLPRGR